MADFVNMFVSSGFSGCRVRKCGFLAAVYRSRQDPAVRGDVRDPSGQGLCCVWPSCVVPSIRALISKVCNLFLHTWLLYFAGSARRERQLRGAFAVS